MELMVNGRQYDLKFQYDMVHAVRRWMYRESGDGVLVISRRKTRKQPLQFDDVEACTICGELATNFLVLDTRRRITAVIASSIQLDTGRNQIAGVEASGSAVCSPKDNFSKARGRKIALARALSQFPKDFRTAFWKAYRERFTTETRRTQRSEKK